MSTLSLVFDNTPNSSAIGTVTLPITGTGLAVSINWGDGTSSSSLSHYYSWAGPYTAVITVTSGTVTQFGNNGTSWTGADKLTEVATNNTSTWGLPGVSSFFYAFYLCTTLTVVPTQIPSSVTRLWGMFGSCYVFNHDIGNWNTSNVTNMSQMFMAASDFNQDISGWNVSNVKDMEQMFSQARNFNQDIGFWDTRNVTEMERMFLSADAFNKNIRFWDTSNVTNYDSMFTSATAMISAYGGVTGFGTTPTSAFFNQNLRLTFDNSPGAVSLPITGSGLAVSINWGDGTSNTSFSHTYSGAGPYTAVIRVTSGTVTQFGNGASSTWSGAYDKLTQVATADTSTWGLPGVSSFTGAFHGCSALTQVPTQIPSSVTDTSAMFQGCNIFIQDIGNWDMSNVTNMYQMFYYAYAFNQPIGSWDVSKVTNMHGMFRFAAAFNQDIGNWDTSNVTDMESMFYAAYVFNKDIRYWDTRKVTNYLDMFMAANAFSAKFSPFPNAVSSFPVSESWTFTTSTASATVNTKDYYILNGSSGYITASTSGSLDTYLRIYQIDSSSSLSLGSTKRTFDGESYTQIATDDDDGDSNNASKTFTVDANVKYVIAFGGYTSNIGSTTLNVAFTTGSYTAVQSIGNGIGYGTTPSSTFFNQFSDNGVTYYFTEDSNNDVTITSAVSSTGSPATIADITIPGSFTAGGVVHTIRHIGNTAFYNNNITSTGTLTIPASVTTIGSEAFRGTGFQTVTFAAGSGLLTIGGSAFQQTSITSVHIPASVTSLGSQSFYFCTSLASVTFAAGIQFPTIGGNTFGNTAITSITIPASVTSIGNNAFDNCSSLASVIIPASVTSIGDYAFRNTDITSIVIPASVTSIGIYAFNLCGSLTSVTFDDIENSALLTIGNNAFSYAAFTSIIIPASVTSIEIEAFYYVNTLTSVTFIASTNWGTGITIGNNSFDSSSSTAVLANVFIKDGQVIKDSSSNPITTTLGTTGAFFGSPSSTVIRSYEIAGSGAFEGGDYFGAYSPPYAVLTNTFATDGWTSIASSMFQSTQITYIDIPDTVTAIGAQAFLGTPLVSINIPAPVTSIQTGTFQDCSNLTSVTFKAGSELESIASTAFQKTSITSIDIPASVTSIGSSAFYQCSSLASVTFAAGSELLTIETTAFRQTALTSIEFPEKITEIKSSAFRETAITSIVIPASVTNIGQHAFEQCSSLTIVTFIESTNWTNGITIGTNAFQNTANLVKVFIKNGQKLDGTAYSTGGAPTTLFGSSSVPFYSYVIDGSGAFTGSDYSTAGSPPYAVLTGWTSIGNSAIPGASITYIEIPTSVTSIGNGAFQGTALTSISIPASVTSIGNQAFDGCSSLASVTFTADSGLLTIGANAFQETTLTSISIPASVTDIGNNAFYKITGLTSATFDDIENSALDTIGSSAFRETAITYIIIPASVTDIGQSAFETVPTLTSVTFIESTDWATGITIGTNAFQTTTALANVFIKNGQVIKDSSSNPITTTLGTTGAFFGSPSTTVIRSYEIAGSGVFNSSDYTGAYSPPYAVLTNTSTGWTSIDGNAFQNTALTYIEIPETVTSIGALAFLNTPLTSINIPASVTSIGDNAFSQASSLALVTFTAGSGLLTIGIAAFIVTAITSISIPATVTTIGAGAFAETALTSVIFERTTGAITIGQDAFADNTSLSNKTIYISTSVASSLTGGPLTSPSSGTTTFYGATVYLAPTFKPTTKADLVTEVGNWCAGTPNTPHISLWDTSQIDNMSNLFEYKTTFNDDISNWDVSSVTDMGSMFNGASAFNQNIRVWDTDDVSNYADMFTGATEMISTYNGVTGFGTTPTAVFFNYAPTFTSTPVTVATQGQVYTYMVATSDVDGDTVTLTGTTIPSWLGWTAATGELSGTPGNSDVGSNSVIITANDGTVDVTQEFNISVANVNDAPNFTSTAVTNATQDQAYTYTVTAIDIDVGDTVTFTAPTKPTWLTFDASTRVLSGTPGNSDVGTSGNAVVIAASDGNGGVTNQSFTITVANVDDAVTGSISISGTVQEGATLTADTSGLSDPDGSLSFTYLWKSSTDNINFSNISGETSNTYDIPSDQTMVGKYLRVIVTTTDPHGGSETFTATTGQVANVDDAVTGSISISGTVQEGATLTAVTSGLSDPDGSLSFTYLWKSSTDNINFSNISGETNNTYDIPSDQTMVGKYLRVIVTTTDPEDGTGTFSATTGQVANVDDAVTGSISISGTVQEGATLTAHTSGLSDPDGSLSFTYLWKSSTDNINFSNISGETSNTYDIPSDQTMVGKYLQVIVTTTDPHGGSETFTETTAPVANVNDAPTFTSIPVTVATQGQVYTYMVTTNDVDGDTVTLTGTTIPIWLNWTAATGELSGTPGNSDVGSNSVVITANDGTIDVTQSFTITVANVNDAPTFTSTPVTVATEDQAYNYTVITNDVDGDTVTLTGTTIPGWLTFDASTRVLSGTPLNANVGNNSVVITANDGTVDVTQSFTISVANVNDAPNFTSTAVTSATQGVLYSYTVTASDDDGDTITFTAPTKPTWLTFDASTRVLSGTPGNSDVGTSGNAVVIAASDGNGGVTNQSFTITVANVNDAPTFTSTPVTSATQGASYSYTVITNDIDIGDTITLTGTTIPSWLTLNTTTGVLSGTPRNLDVGNNSVVITANDGTVDVTQSFTISVANVNDPPTFTSIPDTSATRDTPYSYMVTTNDIDTGSTVTLTGTTIPSWLSLNTTTGELSGTPDYSNLGTSGNAVVITANDGTVDVTQEFTITVANIPSPPTFTSTPITSATQGVPYAYTVTADDTNGDTVTFILTAPTEPTWLTLNTTTGELTGTPGNSDVGDHSVIITATDGTFNVTQEFIITVANVNDPPTFTSTPITSATQDTPYSYTIITDDVDTGSTVTLTGTTIPGWLTLNTTTRVLSGTPGNSDVGNNSVVITASDGTVDVTQEFTIVVANVNDPPTFTSTPVTSATQGQVYSYTVTTNDIDGDTVTLMGTTIPNWLDWTTATGELTGTPGNSDVGEHPVLITADDETDSVIQSFIITVDNVNDPPTFTSTPVTTATQDAPYSYTVATNDIDTGSTVTLTGTTIPNWLSLNTTTGVLSGTPLNANVGNNSVVITASDGTVDVTQGFTIIVADLPSPPTFTSTPVTDATQGVSYSYMVTTDDNNGDTVTLTGTTIPSWLTLKTTTGKLTGTPGNSDVGDHQVLITATDGTFNVTQSFTITVANVNDPPTFTSTPVTGATQDAFYSYTVTTNDIEGDTVTLTGTTIPSWLTLNTTTGVLSGTPGNSDVGTSGNAVVIAASDGNGGVTNQSFTIRVTNTNDPLIGTVMISSKVARYGQFLTALNTISDIDGLGTLNYQWNRDGIPIAGTNSSTYRLTEPDVGTIITVTAFYTDGYGTFESVTSNGTDKILPNINNTVIPSNPLNNAELNAANAMPLKDSTTDGSSKFSIERILFARTKDLKEADNKKWYGSSADTNRRAKDRHLHHRVNYPTTVFNTEGTPTSFTTNNSINVQRQAVHRTRNAGSVVPAKVAKTKTPL